MAIKNEKNLSSFGQKLYELMKEQCCETPKALAKKLLEAKLVSVKSRKSRDEDIYKKKDNAIGSIEKKIRNHLYADDATCLQGEFVNAYCKFFGCSADFLFGYTNVRTPDVEKRKICEMTGLSEAVVNCFIENKQDISEGDTFSYTTWWSELLNGDGFYDIPKAWFIYACKMVEIDELNMHIEAAGRAAAEVELGTITKYMLDDDNQKTLRILRREKEDSFYGAYHKMFSCIEYYLNQYASEWAHEHIMDHEEIYYQNELNKRKILKAHEDSLK